MVLGSKDLFFITSSKLQNSQAEKHGPCLRAPLQQIGRRVQPQPPHRSRVRIPRPGFVVMDQVPRVFEMLPLFDGEDIAPGTRSASDRLESAHLLHAVDLDIGEVAHRVIALLVDQTAGDGRNVHILEQGKHVDAIVVPRCRVLNVSETGFTRRERIDVPLQGFGDNLQLSFSLRFPIETKQSGGKILCGVNYARRIAGPEPGLRASGQQMRVSSAKANASGEGLQRACVGPCRGQLPKVTGRIIGKIGPVIDKRERSIDGGICILDACQKSEMALDGEDRGQSQQWKLLGWITYGHLHFSWDIAPHGGTSDTVHNQP